MRYCRLGDIERDISSGSKNHARLGKRDETAQKKGVHEKTKEKKVANKIQKSLVFLLVAQKR